MSKAEERAKERYWLEPNNIETQEKYAAYVEGYYQAEKDIKVELSKLFQEFLLDCIGNNKDIVILHFMDVFKNKIKEIGK